jgi:hypothetical protein
MGPAGDWAASAGVKWVQKRSATKQLARFHSNSTRMIGFTEVSDSDSLIGETNSTVNTSQTHEYFSGQATGILITSDDFLVAKPPGFRLSVATWRKPPMN